MDNKFKLFILFLPLILFNCTKNSCDDLNDGIYIYPEVKGKSLKESIELYKIPKEILQCISTNGLIQSCINYPEMRLIWTRNSLQAGFDYIEEICNGFDELWTRKDKNEALIDLYSQLDFQNNWITYSSSDIDIIIRYELILAQNEILLDLTDIQKLKLFQLVLENQKIKSKSQDFGGLGMASSLAIISRIMLNDQYPPFLEKYKNNMDIRISVDLIQGLQEKSREEIMTIAEDFLEILKNK
jgi:hypothetical protein